MIFIGIAFSLIIIGAFMLITPMIIEIIKEFENKYYKIACCTIYGGFVLLSLLLIIGIIK